MITMNPAINSTILFYDEDSNNVDWNIKYSLTNHSSLLNEIYHFKLVNATYHELNKLDLIKFHLTGLKLVKLLNATNTKFKYRYYLNWFSLIKLVLLK